MDRIAIIGCGGSGKTTLAHQLAARLHLPADQVHHLDELYYDSNWATLDPEKFAALQHGLVAEPRWIIDGNYASTLPIRLAAADTIIYLDVPTTTVIWGLLRRRLRYRGGQHHSGVYDRITREFLRYVLTFRQQRRPALLALLDQHATHANVTILHSHRDAARWLAALPAHF